MRRFPVIAACLLLPIVWLAGCEQAEPTSASALTGAEPATTEPEDMDLFGPPPLWAREAVASAKEDSPANQGVREMMDKTVPEIRFPNVTFETALSFLRDLQRVSINPNWAAMEAVGITKDTPITLHLRDVTFDTVLRELLVKAAEREGVLDYMIRDGVVKVSTVEDLASIHFVQLHDVSDLLWPKRDDEAELKRRTTGQVELVTAESARKRASAFLDLLRATILPETWAPQGSADLFLSGRWLVVRQNASGHREVARLLWQLREHTRRDISLEVRPIAVAANVLQVVRGIVSTQPSGDAILGIANDKTVFAVLATVRGEDEWTRPAPARTVLRHAEQTHIAFIPPADETSLVGVAMPAPATHARGIISLNLRASASTYGNVIVTIWPVSGANRPVLPSVDRVVLVPNGHTLLLALPMPGDKAGRTLLVLVWARIVIPDSPAA